MLKLMWLILLAKNKIGLNNICETKMNNSCNAYEECDFCCQLLPINHFYPVDTAKYGRNFPLDMVKEPKPKICKLRWCFSAMVGVPYNPIKSEHQYK